MNIDEKIVEQTYQKLKKDAEENGYYLNPDKNFTKELIMGLLKNEQRYGYMSCPCRLSTGVKEEDLDIICPCDYRDSDLEKYGACYCGLYVSEEIFYGRKKLSSIPESRNKNFKKNEDYKISDKKIFSLSFPVWRCKVCGYLCARESPPEICPICKAKKERFEKFI